MLVSTEWFLVFGSMFLPDCDICARTSAHVNDGILDKSSDHLSVGYLRKAGCLTLHLEFCRDVVSVLNKSGRDQGLPVDFYVQNRCILRPFIKHEAYCKHLRENTTIARVIMTIEYCSWPYLLTKAAFVLSPFSESPLHYSQNFNSSFFKVAGDLPQREDPRISSSVSWQAAICAKS